MSYVTKEIPHFYKIVEKEYLRTILTFQKWDKFCNRNRYYFLKKQCPPDSMVYFVDLPLSHFCQDKVRNWMDEGIVEISCTNPRTETCPVLVRPRFIRIRVCCFFHPRKVEISKKIRNKQTKKTTPIVFDVL